MTTNLLKSISVAEIANELSSRKNKVGKIRSPHEVLPFLSPWLAKESEHFIIITLDGAHQVINVEVVTKGLVNRTLIHPREVYRPAIRDNAVAIIATHNHPSGCLEPSAEDYEIKDRIVQAGEIIGIPCLDFIIFGKTGYYSALESGELL